MATIKVIGYEDGVIKQGVADDVFETNADFSCVRAFFDDVLLMELSIPGVQLQTDTNAYTFTCPYDLEITGIQLILDNHGTSGNVTVTTSVVGGATLDSTSITLQNTFAATSFSSNRNQGDDIRFAITATPATNTNGLRGNLLFRRR